MTSLLCRLKRLLSRATKELRVYEARGGLSQLNLQGEVKKMVNEIGRLRTKVSFILFGLLWWFFFCNLYSFFILLFMLLILTTFFLAVFLKLFGWFLMFLLWSQ